MPSGELGNRKRAATSGQTTGQNRVRVVLAIFLLTAVLASIFVSIRRGLLEARRAEQDREFIQDIEQRGGLVVLAPSGRPGEPRTVVAVELRGTGNGPVLQKLSQFGTLERLDLDGAELGSEEYASLWLLPNLHSLSLADSNFSDEDVPTGGRLQSLSLSGTSITDAGLARLASLKSLTRLELMRTSVTAKGLESLIQLPSLKALEIDDACITPESVRSLLAMKSLESVRIEISDGMGKPTKELLRALVGSVDAQGIHPGGQLLWNAALPWESTLAGVVEAVADVACLRPGQVTQLMKIIGSADVTRSTTAVAGRDDPHVPSGKQILSVDEFLRRIQESKYPTPEVRAFARDGFEQQDLPKLLDAMRSVDDLGETNYLHIYGSYLLVRDGLDSPLEKERSEQQLDRMFQHRSADVRGAAVYAFSQYGHPFQEDWSPSERAITFGLPRIMQLCHDTEPKVYLAASEVLGHLASHAPNRADEVMSVLVGMLERGKVGYVHSSIKRIAGVNPQAALNFIPRLQRLLAETQGEGQEESWIRALCVVARASPSTAREVAVTYVRMLADRKASGKWLTALVTTDNSDAVEAIVHGLLDIPANDRELSVIQRNALIAVARAIRDQRLKDVE
jgi:hypothetical protein